MVKIAPKPTPAQTDSQRARACLSETVPTAQRIDFTPYVTEKAPGSYAMDFIVKGAKCGGCLAKIEDGLSSLDFVKRSRMNLSSLRLNVQWQGPINPKGSNTVNASTINDIALKLESLGFSAAPYETSEVRDHTRRETQTLLWSMAVAGFAAMNVMFLSVAVWSGGQDMSEQTRTLFHWISALIALPTIAYSGQIFFRSAQSALKQGETNMDVPISLALILACGLSLYETIKSHPDTYFDAAVMLLFLLLIGRYLEARLRFQTGEAARRLGALQVTSATRLLANGRIETVAAKQIEANDRLLIPAGQRIAVDCVIESGRSDVDMQIATGETKPQTYGPGDTLYSGTTNLTVPLTVKAIAKYSDSFLSEVIELVEMGEQKKGRFMRIADRAAKAYVPLVHTIALLTFIGWLYVSGDLRMAALNAIAVLIITCPCALGLAVPAVQIVASGRLFNHGVLLKSGDALERLAQVKHVIFDKTGTLTQGRFTLENADAISKPILGLAGALAKYSNHPLSRALTDYAQDITLEDVQELRDIQEVSGQGISAKLRGGAVKLGSAEFVGLERAASETSQVWLKIDDEEPICFDLSDEVRPDAQETVQALRGQNLSVEMLSGDQEAVTQSVAEHLGIARFSGALSPKQKMDIIDQRECEGFAPLMVGDGINDAPALAAARCSASMAGAADVSRASADIILQGDKLSRLPYAVATARTAHKRVVENLTLAICYNFIAIPLAVFGYVNPLIAALAMSASSLLVTLNALRMMDFKRAVKAEKKNEGKIMEGWA